MRIKAPQHPGNRALIDGLLRVHRIGRILVRRHVDIDELLQKMVEFADVGREKQKQRWKQRWHHREYRRFFRASCRANASSISLSTSLGMGTPLCSHILGNMLIEVKPGMVLISFR